MSRPVMYKDWRSLWHSTSRELGWHVFHRWQRNEFLVDRRTWELLSRLHRIQLRLDVEHLVMDDSYCEAVLELIAKPEEKP